jgi:glycosyltransferase involved in cell wall biosynthesis
LRASAPWFAERIREQVEEPQVILASGLVDAAVFRALVGCRIPTVLYMHESQSGYPGREWDVENVARNWVSMLAVDEVWFNSDFHRWLALDGHRRLARTMPEEQRVTAPLEPKCRVVHPGVDLSWAEQLPSHDGPPVIVWPHRWDDDKNPTVFEAALDRLVDARLDFRLVLAGQERLDGDECRRRIARRHADRVLAVGPFDVEDYRRWLHRGDIVVSCTDHEFFGIAVVEALATGCRPVLPDDFSYPEIVGPAYADHLYSRGSFGSALEKAVRGGGASSVDVRRFDWRTRIEEYDSLLERLAATEP